MGQSTWEFAEVKELGQNKEFKAFKAGNEWALRTKAFADQSADRSFRRAEAGNPDLRIIGIPKLPVLPELIVLTGLIEFPSPRH